LVILEILNTNVGSQQEKALVELALLFTMKRQYMQAMTISLEDQKIGRHIQNQKASQKRIAP
jgi:hypothetical protein